MTSRLVRTVSVFALTIALGLTAPSAPAQAQSAEDALKLFAIGEGLKILRNELERNRSNSGSSSKNRNSSAGSSSSGGGNPFSPTVRRTQAALNGLGYDAGPVDGQPGRRTRTAIEAFQRDQGFAVTGTLSDTQFAALNRAFSLSGDSVPPGTITAEAIFEAQTYLNSLGYDVGKPDGAWGPRSQAALDKYRTSLGGTTGVKLALADIQSLHLQAHGTPSSIQAPVSITGGAVAGLSGSGALGLGAPGSSGLSLGQKTASTSAPGLNLGQPSGLSLGQPGTSGSGQGNTTPNVALGQGIQPSLGNSTAPSIGNAPGQNLGQGAQPNFGSQGAPSLGATPGTLLGQNGQPSLGSQQQPSGLGGNTQLAMGAVNTPNFGPGAAPSLALKPKPKDPSAYFHLARRGVAGMPNIGRDIALQVLRQRPAFLENPQTLQQMFLMENTREKDTYGLRFAYDEGNSIEKEDILARYKGILLDEVSQVSPISPDNPFPVAFYSPTQIGDYVEGRGLQLSNAPNVRYQNAIAAPQLRAAVSITTILPDVSFLPITRDEARALIDYVAQSKKQLHHVVWGQVSTIGKDTTISEFANQTLSANRGQVPSTFTVDRITLSLAGRGSRQQEKISDTVFTFDLESSTEPAPDGIDALSFLQQNGAPIMNGHALIGAGNRMLSSLNGVQSFDRARADSAYANFELLLWLSQNPEFVGTGMNFVPVAAQTMDEQELRSFFGNRINSNSYNRYMGVQFSVSDSVAQGLFADEFAAQDAKQTYLRDYLPAVLARAPKGPLNTLSVVKGSLGSYNFAGGYFPITYEAVSNSNARLPVVQLPGRDRNTAMRSVQEMASFPEKLELTVDEARELRARMTNGNTVYLAWTATLDFENTPDAEGSNEPNQSSRVAPLRMGTASLNRIALFLDPQFTQPLLELDPIKMAIDPRQVANAAREALSSLEGVEATLARMTLTEPYKLLKNAVDLVGDASLRDSVIASHNSVRAANEFQVDEAKQLVAAEWDAIEVQDHWFSTKVSLGRYDREREIFPIDPQSIQRIRYTMGRENDFGVYPSSRFVETSFFEPLSVQEDIARKIVEENLREVTVFVRAQAIGATHDGGRDGSSLNFEVLLEPQEVIFTQPALGENAVLAHILYEKNSTFFEETFTAADFPELRQRQKLDMGTLLLLRAAQMSDAQIDEALDSMMAETYYHESRNAGEIAQPFFVNSLRFEESKLSLYRPRFRSWLNARAEALGKEFYLVHDNRVTQPSCGDFSIMRSDYDIMSQLGVATGKIYIETDRVTALSKAPGEPRTARDHLYFLGKIEGTSQMRCAQRGLAGVVSLDNVGILPAESLGQPAVYQARRIEFELRDAEFKANAGGTETLLLNGSATMTAYYDKPPRMVATSTPILEVVGASVGEGTSPSSDASDATGAENSPATTDAAWPEVDPQLVTLSEIDAVGIHIGDAFAEADAKIRSDFDVNIIYETLAPADDNNPALAYMRTYVASGGLEAISVMSFAPDAPVTAVARQLLREGAPFPQDRIRSALEGKYGAPISANGTGTELLWSGAPTCRGLPLSPSSNTNKIAMGEPQGNFNPQATSQIVTMAPTIKSGNETFLEQNTSCGPTLMFSTRLLARMDGHFGFLTFLTDPGVLASVNEAMQPEEPEIEIKF